MLERVAIVRYVVIIVVGIGKERVARGKHVAGREIGLWQHGLAGVLNHKQALILVVPQVLTQLVAQVGVGVAVAHNFNGLGATYTAVVGSYNHLAIHLSQLAEEIADNRMAEPREGYRAIGTLVVGQLAHHLRFGTGVAQHVDKVKHHYVERVLIYLVHLLHQLIGIGLGVYLVIRKSFLAAIALQLGTDERLFVQVLTLLLVFIHPKIGEHLLYLVGHQTTENGVACILRSGGQYAVIHILVDIKILAQLARQHTPLVVAEVIEHHQEHFFTHIEHGEHLGFKYLGG